MVDLLIFALGFVAGVSVLALLQRVFSGAPTPNVTKAATRFPFPWTPAPKPQPKRPEVTAIPRSAGSWRRQKAQLERDHNSKQKERDQRVAGL